MAGDADDMLVHQQAQAGHDAYVAGHDLHVHHHHNDPRAPPRKVWGGVPARNPGFTGRAEVLASVRDALHAGDRAVVQALHGMGGVGKTQIATQYAHACAGSYDVVWWINAENATLIGEQFAALGGELGCAGLGDPLGAVQRAVLATLHQRDRWLLVFDNAVQPEDVSPWLPSGAGHVLITSRSQGWDEIAVPVPVDVLAREESVAILRERVRALTDDAADLVADVVGDLPLAVVQAAGFMARTAIPAAQYVGLVRDRVTEILDRERPSSYPRSLVAVTQLAYDQMRETDPAAADLAVICAYLAPEPIPAQWFTSACARLIGDLAKQAADEMAWREVLSRLARSALARIDPGDLVMHRLTQAILRAHVPPDLAATARAMAEAIVAANDPGNVYLPATWAGWARVLPHLLFLEPASSKSIAISDMVCNASWYLVRRGEFRAGHDLARQVYDNWRARLGPDDPDTLQAGNALAAALRGMGQIAQASAVDRDNLDRERRLHGDDAPNTLVSATNLATDLFIAGDFAAAREIYEDTLARYRRVLGEDHPYTLGSARGFAICLRGLGETRAARELNEDTLARFGTVLGEDHLETLRCAVNLANDLYMLGEHQAARELHMATMSRQQRILGDDHPDVLYTAFCVAYVLRALGDYQAARDIDDDILTRRRRVLGEDHPDTRISERNLAEDQRALAAAREQPGRPD